MERHASGAADRVRWARAAAFAAPAATAAWRAAGSFTRLADASRPTLTALGLSPAFLAQLEAARHCEAQDLRWLEQPGHTLVLRSDPDYPPLLATLPEAPFALWVRGTVSALRAPQVAVVGSRRATATGRELATEFAEALATAGWTVTSGLAEGIDAAAHRGALRAAVGTPCATTLAVCGTGPDQHYPRHHGALADQIAAAGAVVTEFPPGTPARPAHFPYRNRILAGLSLATVVIEAAVRSGSLVTARLAAEQGREVYAVPGSVRNPAARGCHALLRDGARLVENATDVLNELKFSSLLAAGMTATPQPRAVPASQANPPLLSAPRLDREAEILLDALGYEATDVDTLVSRTGLPPSAVSTQLLLLELRGMVEPRAGGKYARLASLPGAAGCVPTAH